MPQQHISRWMYSEESELRIRRKKGTNRELVHCISNSLDIGKCWDPLLEVMQKLPVSLAKNAGIASLVKLVEERERKSGGYNLVPHSCTLLCVLQQPGHLILPL